MGWWVFLYFSSFLLFVFLLAVVSILLVYLSVAGGLFCFGFNISCLLPIKKKKEKKERLVECPSMSSWFCISREFY